MSRKGRLVFSNCLFLNIRIKDLVTFGGHVPEIAKAWRIIPLKVLSRILLTSPRNRDTVHSVSNSRRAS